MLRIPARFLVLLLVFALCGCLLGKPSGDDGANAPGTQKVEIPSLPKGQIRLYGVLESEGQYYCGENDSTANKRGWAWETIPFGTSGHGSWFYADVDAATGTVVAVRLYFNVDDEVQLFATWGDLNESVKGSYGTVDAKSFAFTVQGTDFMRDYSRDVVSEEGVEDEAAPAEVSQAYPKGMAAVINGKGDLLAASDGATFAVNVYMAWDSQDLVPGRAYTTKDCEPTVMAHGQARVMRR